MSKGRPAMAPGCARTAILRGRVAPGELVEAERVAADCEITVGRLVRVAVRAFVARHTARDAAPRRPR